MDTDGRRLAVEPLLTEVLCLSEGRPKRGQSQKQREATSKPRSSLSGPGPLPTLPPARSASGKEAAGLDGIGWHCQWDGERDGLARSSRTERRVCSGPLSLHAVSYLSELVRAVHGLPVVVWAPAVQKHPREESGPGRGSPPWTPSRPATPLPGLLLSSTGSSRDPHD